MPVDRPQLFRRPEGQVELLVEVRLEDADPVHLDGKPDAQPPPVSGELRGDQVEVDEVRVLLHRGHVVGRERVGAPQGGESRTRSAPVAIRQKQPLVRVERDRVGALDAGEPAAAPLGQKKESAVGAVRVKPELLLAGDVREGLEVVDRARVGRAGIADHGKGLESRSPIRRDRFGQCVDRDSKLGVRGDLSHVLCRESGEHRGLLDRMMGLVGDVDRAGEEVLRQAVAPGRDQGREIRERPAGCQNPAGRRGVADDLAEPANDVCPRSARDPAPRRKRRRSGWWRRRSNRPPPNGGARRPGCRRDSPVPPC